MYVCQICFKFLSLSCALPMAFVNLSQMLKNLRNGPNTLQFIQTTTTKSTTLTRNRATTTQTDKANTRTKTTTTSQAQATNYAAQLRQLSNYSSSSSNSSSKLSNNKKKQRVKSCCRSTYASLGKMTTTMSQEAAESMAEAQAQFTREYFDMPYQVSMKEKKRGRAWKVRICAYVYKCMYV